MYKVSHNILNSVKSFRLLPVVFISLIFFLSQGLQAQIQSVNNTKGYWIDETSWLDNQYPGVSINDTNINIYGELYSRQCLDFNLSTLTISDTLIIHGNLELKNTSNLIIDKGAILVILGDYVSKNKVDVINNGTLLVAGSFKMSGSDNQGSFLNNGITFLLDESPIIKDDSAYQSLGCKEINPGDTICGYMDKIDFKFSDLYSYITRLPFNIDSISTNGNFCFKLVIKSDRTELCPEEIVTFQANTIGVEQPDNLHWDFGEDAIPVMASGLGPHEVYYTSEGVKSIELSYSDNPDEITSKTLIVNSCENGDSIQDKTYAFTPNGDGFNDYWIIEGIENYPLAKIKVFDRNGKIVFQSEGDYQNTWDGKYNGEVLNMNSYFFIIDRSAYNEGMVNGIVTILHE